MVDQLAYRMKPAGHDAPVPRRNYEKASNKLVEAFEKWLEISDKHPGELEYKYQTACELTEHLNVSVAEAHSLLLKYGEKAEKAGLFVSAIYNRSPEKYLVYDLNPEEPTSYLGYRLNADKILVNKGHADSFGPEAFGVIINCSKANNLMGYKSTGLIINYDDTFMGLGKGSKGMVINCGTSSAIIEANFVIAVKQPNQIARPNKCILEDACKNIPGLIAYLDGLKRKIEANEIRAFKRLKNPSQRIKTDIENILREAGYNV